MDAGFLNRTLAIRAARVAVLAVLMALAFVVMVVAAPPAYAGGPSGSDVQIDGGGRATCAITTTGAVHCWGANDYGQAPESVPGTFIQLTRATPTSAASKRAERPSAGAAIRTPTATRWGATVTK